MRGFLNEIKNTAINHVTNRVNNMVSEALGGATGLPRRTGGVTSQDAYAKMDNPFDGKHIAYPEDLGSADQSHYLIFEINEQVNANVKFPGLRKTSGRTSPDRPIGKNNLSIPRAATRKLKSSIALYMPATVGVSQASQYGEVEMGAIAMNVANIAKSVEGKSGLEFVKGVFDKANREAAKTSGGEAMETVLKQGADVFAKGAAAAYDISRGTVTNNRLEMQFQGIGRRSFSFSFKMMPKSENEAINVHEIVRMFRFYMAPSFEKAIATSRTMIVPATFEIKYMFRNGENEFLNRISTCVLETCNVTYGGEKVGFFRPTLDGKGAPPVETAIELQFKELEIITREKLKVGF